MANGRSSIPPLVIVTGQSGAGRTLALRAFEDLGYFCVDNLPPTLLLTFAELVRRDPEIRGTAIAIDVRGGTFFQDLSKALEDLESHGLPFRIVFLEADEAVLIHRYKASRRAHPFGQQYSLVEAIGRERQALEGLRGRADVVIDTSQLSPQQLRERIAHDFSFDREGLPFRVRVLSFGYKHGIPADADLVFDVRFLPNPYYVDELRHKTGDDPAVEAYVLGCPVGRETLAKLQDLLDYLVPLYRREGKANLSVAIGCTGGQHRSVVFANAIGRHLAQQGIGVEVEHRDTAAGEAP
jgi:UPF0042 nucleotide-binding protein